MGNYFGMLNKLRDHDGVTAIVVGIMLTIFLGLAAFVIDIGYSRVTKNELQNIADGAALAAARKLGVIYEPMSYTDIQSYDAADDEVSIKDIAIDVADKSKAGGKGNIIINNDDIVIGTWDPSGTPKFNPTLNKPNAVQVTARRDNIANGPISTFFARVFGIDSTDVSADATAALTGQSTADEGGLPLPVGISKAWFLNKEDFCNQPIKFYPTGTAEGCAGWNVYEENPSNASKLRKTLQDLASGSYESPETTAGQTEYDFTGGTVASAFSDMKALFDVMRIKNDGELDKDDDPNTWTTSVPVYDWQDCSNPNADILIIGFATVVIDEILETPDKIISAHVICENIEPARGGGPQYGTWGSIPGLVE
ncbi:MAG TPA: hypothetical protein DDX85_06465 [Nitrospiraceae bacterium]|nr:hypothetical protein [Nitrospiraceae bacterium]